MSAGQYIAVIGGFDKQKNLLREAEVIKISDEGVVSTSTCKLHELQFRYAAESNNLICGGKNPGTTNECKELNLDSLKWEEHSAMKKKRIDHAMTIANNQTYVCGGNDESGTMLKSCEKLNGEWSFIKDLPRPLDEHCMIGTEDSIYVIGGKGGSWVSE